MLLAIFYYHIVCIRLEVCITLGSKHFLMIHDQIYIVTSTLKRYNCVYGQANMLKFAEVKYSQSCS